MPSKQMIMSMLGRLKDAGILIVTRESSGWRPQILAFPELVNLCEGHEVFRIPRIKRKSQALISGQPTREHVAWPVLTASPHTRTAARVTRLNTSNVRRASCATL